MGLPCPHRDISLQRPVRRCSTTAAFPSSTFRTSSTACSATDLVGLFHPTATSRVRSSGASPPVQPGHLVGGPFPLVVGFSSLPTVRPADATNLLPRPQGFDPAGNSCLARRFLINEQARSPLEFRLLQVLTPDALKTISRLRSLLTFSWESSSRSPTWSAALHLASSLAGLLRGCRPARGSWPLGGLSCW